MTPHVVIPSAAAIVIGAVLWVVFSILVFVSCLLLSSLNSTSNLHLVETIFFIGFAIAWLIVALIVQCKLFRVFPMNTCVCYIRAMRRRGGSLAAVVISDLNLFACILPVPGPASATLDARKFLPSVDTAFGTVQAASWICLGCSCASGLLAYLVYGLRRVLEEDEESGYATY